MNQKELLKNLKATASELTTNEELSDFAKVCIARKVNALNENSPSDAILRTLSDIILITEKESK